MEICFANLYIKFCIDIFHDIHERSRKFGIGQVSDSFLRVCKEGRENEENIAKNLYIFDEK